MYKRHYDKVRQFEQQVMVNRKVMNQSQSTISLPEEYVTKKTDTHVQIKLPKNACQQYKQNVYIWVPVKDIMVDKENKKIILSAEFGTKHMIYDKNDKVIDTVVSSRLRNIFETKGTIKKLDITKKAARVMER